MVDGVVCKHAGGGCCAVEGRRLCVEVYEISRGQMTLEDERYELGRYCGSGGGLWIVRSRDSDVGRRLMWSECKVQSE